MTYPFHKHVRLCELNLSKPRQYCISVKSYPYDLTRTIPPLQVYCARPNGEYGVLEVLSQENATYLSLHQVLQHGMRIR